MAIIHRHRHPGFWTTRRVPSEAVEVDWGHPLASGLGDFNTFANNTNYANVSGQPVNTGSVTYAPSTAGPGILMPGNSSNYTSITNSQNLATAAFSVSLLWVPVSVTGSFAVSWDKAPASVSSREMSLFLDTSLNADFVGIGTFQQSISITTGMSFGQLYELTLTRDSSFNCSLYVNGALTGTFFNNGVTSVPDPIVFSYNVSAGGNNTSANYIRWATWQNRCLSASEVAQLASEPFGLLRPTARRGRSWG